MARVAFAVLPLLAIWAAGCGGGTRELASPCPVHAVGKQLLDRQGHPVYRYPGYRVPKAQVKCSGHTIWVLFHGGGEMSQEAYVGVRSADAGKTWRLLLAEPYFGVKAPFTIDSYSGPWTIVGQKRAYFVGWCPACGAGTTSLTTTRDGGRHFHRYAVPRLDGFYTTGIRVSGDRVTSRGRTSAGQARAGARSRSASTSAGAVCSEVVRSRALRGRFVVRVQQLAAVDREAAAADARRQALA